MDNVYIDQGLWNRVFGRFKLWRKLRGGHWERYVAPNPWHGWAKIWHSPEYPDYDPCRNRGVWEKNMQCEEYRQHSLPAAIVKR